jgi:hypothetical protein
MTVTKAIAHANSLMPGLPADEGCDDPRWRAIIEVGNFIETDPEPVWQFVRQWGNCSREDVRDAIACCLLEHLLEHHFELIFPRVEKAVKEAPLFADTFGRCWLFGQADVAGNFQQFERLKLWCKTARPKWDQS